MTGGKEAKHSRIVSAAIITGSVVAVIVAIEILARTAFPVTDFPPGADVFANPEVVRYDGPVFWRFKPKVTAFDRRQKLSYSINSIGFRSHENIIESRLFQGVRIIAAGDSCVFGLGSKWGFDIELQIGLDEKAGRKTFEVINMGVPGYSSEQVKQQLRAVLPRYKPDVLLLSVGWDDATPALDGVSGDFDLWLRGQRIAPQARAFLATMGMARMFHLGRTSSGASVLGAEDHEEWRTLLSSSCSAVLDGVEDQLGPLIDSQPALRLRVPVDRYAANLTEIHQLCVLEGTRLVFVPVSLPLPYVQVMRDLQQKLDIPLVETEDALYSDFRRHVMSGPNEPRGPSDMRRSPKVFTDGRHPTILGHQVIGRILRHRLREERLITL